MKRVVLVACLVPSFARADVVASVGVAVDRGDQGDDRVELAGCYRRAVVGARVDHHHAFATAGIRFGRRSTLELGAVAAVAAIDEQPTMFVQHARFVPGWYLRGAITRHRVTLGAELGATGLATRERDQLRGDTRALITLGVEVWR